jgi:desulfoferrodoxin-like iron-binding protein
MAVGKTGEKYRCNICGNEVVVTKAGGGTLVCCGEDIHFYFFCYSNLQESNQSISYNFLEIL